ncbi:PHA/PHB synthase family protein [Motiliproteus sediminis]|uniref:PHA/PHB synthase family protein n=1 Tax=Motiliproteus sediminis TaxID=1468178 RepID=UPI001AEFEFC5|nr:class I poly(R)-hydroxyalkanoic acid synthase [Motiliproteus sediminis]
MDSKDTNTAQEFFTAMNAEAHKVMELFAGKVGEEYLDNLNSAWGQLLSRPTDPQGWLDAVTEYQRSQMQFWAGILTGGKAVEAAPQPGDRRFAAEEWSESPVFNYIKESYLIASNMLNKMVSSVNLDEKSQQKLEFYTQQYIDAMSPTNFAATNPEVIQQAVETKGQSLIDGLQNLLGDMEKGRISMTDEEAFVLGENIATTEGAVVFENELLQLIQYKPLTEKVNERPTLIVPPCINKFYILDLQPGNSFVKYAVEQGQTVFLVSWVNASPEQSNLSWDDYVGNGVLEALEAVKSISGSNKVNTVAWCVGGTILASALAVLSARKDTSVASATFLTTLTDFAEPGDLGVFIDKEQIEQLLKKVHSEGVLNGRNLSTTFNMLRSNDLIWSYVVNNYLKGQAPAPFDILYWNSDPTNLPASMYDFYIRNMYLDNALAQPGKLTVCGESVDLTKIKVPCYFLSCIEDHIAPWKSTFTGSENFSNCEFVLGASGHIAGVINPASKNRRNYWTGGDSGKGADHWLETAERQEGSWWPHWSGWLKKRGGKQVEAPSALGNETHPVIEPAPGRYVAKRLD